MKKKIFTYYIVKLMSLLYTLTSGYFKETCFEPEIYDVDDIKLNIDDYHI